MTVALRGELDLAVARSVTEAVWPALDESVVELVVDLSQLTFLDSSGISVLVALREHCLERGLTVRMQNPSPVALNVLRITGMTEEWGL